MSNLKVPNIQPPKPKGKLEHLGSASEGKIEQALTNGDFVGIAQTVTAEAGVDTKAASRVVVINSRTISKRWNDSVYRQQALRYMNQMTERELRKLLRSIGGAANKRIDRIQSAGVPSPAVDALERVKGDTHFSTRGLGRNELFSAALQAMKFLASKTSSLGGARKYLNNEIERLGYDSSQLTNYQRSNLYRIISRVKEAEGYAPFSFDYNRFAHNIMEMYADEIDVEHSILEDAYDEGISKFDEIVMRGLAVAYDLYQEQQRDFVSRFRNKYPVGKTINNETFD